MAETIITKMEIDINKYERKSNTRTVRNGTVRKGPSSEAYQKPENSRTGLSCDLDQHFDDFMNLVARLRSTPRRLCDLVGTVNFYDDESSPR